MIAAFDVHYMADGGASAAAVLFAAYTDAAPAASYTRFIPQVAAYVPGEFYRRELPCILTLLRRFKEIPEVMIVDGYVKLGNRPGLGQHLYEACNSRIPVIGVAKSKFRDSPGAEVYRGDSRHPLYVTSTGLDLEKAAENIGLMHGSYRIPTLLKLVDSLARKNAKFRKKRGLTPGNP